MTPSLCSALTDGYSFACGVQFFVAGLAVMALVWLGVATRKDRRRARTLPRLA
jgi:hypothetical protein